MATRMCERAADKGREAARSGKRARGAHAHGDSNNDGKVETLNAVIHKEGVDFLVDRSVDAAAHRDRLSKKR